VGDRLVPRARERRTRRGDTAQVRESRVAFQAATEAEFISAVEEITGRSVRAFASGVGPEAHVVFETFSFEPRPPDDRGERCASPASKLVGNP
jgi:hypothetical protein